MRAWVEVAVGERRLKLEGVVVGEERRMMVRVEPLVRAVRVLMMREGGEVEVVDHLLRTSQSLGLVSLVEVAEEVGHSLLAEVEELRCLEVVEAELGWKIHAFLRMVEEQRIDLQDHRREAPSLVMVGLGEVAEDLDYFDSQLYYDLAVWVSRPPLCQLLRTAEARQTSVVVEMALLVDSG